MRVVQRVGAHSDPFRCAVPEFRTEAGERQVHGTGLSENSPEQSLIDDENARYFDFASRFAKAKRPAARRMTVLKNYV